MDKTRKNLFSLHAPFPPAGDQPEAIQSLIQNIEAGLPEQVLLGVTGSGKTYTLAQTIQALGKPTLIISHNKTLAAQLYQEFRDFFPENAVSYFVSYYDYYQPEAYVPSTDTYIEKETEINEEIDKLRLAATTNLLTRPDTIVIASVSCIYNIGSPKEYGHFVLELREGTKIPRESILDRLIQLQYTRSDFGFHRSTFRVRGDVIDVFPAYEDVSIRIKLDGEHVVDITTLDPVTGKTLEKRPHLFLYPAKHYMTDPRNHASVMRIIEKDVEEQVALFTSQKKLIEAHRIEQRVRYDLEMLQEMGYVNGIENYSRYFDGRKAGDPPFTLFDYMKEAEGAKHATVENGQSPWLLVIDESHITVPQIRGMYNGDRARKQTLIDYGFRLPSALDNRPMRFDEFLRGQPQTIYVSATPTDWELSRAKEAGPQAVVEQLVRPTGLLDPVISIRPSEGQIPDLLKEIQQRVAKKQRVLVTTLTKRMAEDLSTYLEGQNILVHYLHADVETLTRSDILADLRKGIYDVIVGINLLREGLDLPEVSLVAILDADKEGFLRSRTSLIQTMGRAARHEEGMVVLYADRMTDSMKAAIEEVERRRTVQIAYNQTHGLTPTTIQKPIRDRLIEAKDAPQDQSDPSYLLSMTSDDIEALPPSDLTQLKKTTEKEMRRASRELEFELAAKLRDFLAELETR